MGLAQRQQCLSASETLPFVLGIMVKWLTWRQDLSVRELEGMNMKRARITYVIYLEVLINQSRDRRAKIELGFLCVLLLLKFKLLKQIFKLKIMIIFQWLDWTKAWWSGPLDIFDVWSINLPPRFLPSDHPCVHVFIHNYAEKKHQETRIRRPPLLLGFLSMQAAPLISIGLFMGMVSWPR